MATIQKRKRASATETGSQPDIVSSAENPLAEPDRGKRITACFEFRGYTQKSFAKEIGCAPSTVYRWAKGMPPVEIDYFIKASKLLDYTIDELVLGLEARARSFSDEQALDDREIDIALQQAGATPAQRRAFSEVEHERQTGGCLHRVLITITFIRRFCDGYTRHRPAGHSHARAAALNIATGVFEGDASDSGVGVD